MTSKTTNKIITIVAVLLIAGLVIVGLTLSIFRPTSGNFDKVAVRLKWLHQAQFAGFYYAREAGFYAEEGLDVTLNPGGVDFPAIQMVAGGSEQFGVTGADQLLLAREKGVPVVALAVIYRMSPMVYFALKESEITKPQDFIGKRVGVKLGSNEELTYRAMMRRLGIDMAQVEEIPVKYDMTPLFTGHVDVWPGYAINEPIVAEEHGYEVAIIWPSDYGVNLYADTIFTTESMVKDNPDNVLKFLRATLKGWQEAVAKPGNAVEYTLRYSDKLNKEHETAMMEASIELLKPDDKPIGWMERERWVEMEKLLLDQGFMKKSINVDEVFTLQFLDEILAE